MVDDVAEDAITTSPTIKPSRGSSSMVGKHASAADALPGWKRKLIAQRQATEAAHRAMISETRSRELQASERLLRLRARAQRELGRAAFLESQYRNLERKRRTVKEAKQQSDHLIGLDVTSSMVDIPAPDEEALFELSAMFNAALRERFRAEERSIHRVYKLADIDGSQRISFAELESLARGPLGLSLRRLTPARLKVLWKGLDRDASGFVDTRELSRFLQLAHIDEPSPSQLARRTLLARREREAAAQRAAVQKLLQKDVAARANSVEVATQAEVDEISNLFLDKFIRQRLAIGEIVTFRRPAREESARP